MRVGFARPGLWALAVFACVLVGCEPPPPAGPSRLSTTVAGLKITANVDGPAFIQPQKDSATITSGFNKIVVDREEVTFNGAQIARLPETVAQVDLTITPGQITVVADGKTILVAPLKK